MATFNMALMHENGWGTRTDMEEAVRCYRKGAELGERLCQTNLGDMLVRGLGVRRDDDEGVRWLQKAARQRCMDAQLMLARLYEKGEGVRRSRNRLYLLGRRRPRSREQRNRERRARQRAIAAAKGHTELRGTIRCSVRGSVRLR